MTISNLYCLPTDWTHEQLHVLHAACRESTLNTARLFFKIRDGARFIMSPHHRVMSNTLDRVSNGEIKRLIINIPPGYTKTEMGVMFFVLKSYIQNPVCRFIHASYSATLATRNSAIIRNMTQDPMFQTLADFSRSPDQWTKDWWKNTAGGEFLAVSADGQVAGFRAGHMDKSQFTGAIIFDDPIKPAEALSKVMREKINFNFSNTFRSRLAHDDVPIIIIMQRVHDDDLSGYLLRGGGHGQGEKWHHLVIPAKIPDIREPYPEKYTHGIPIDHGLPPGPLWPFKHNSEQLEILQNASSFVWSGQYMQDPSDFGAQIFKREYWPRWDFAKGVDKFHSRLWHNGEPIPIHGIHIFADTAMKTGETNDYSVFQMWAEGSNGKIYLIDQIRGKWEAPELERRAVEFFNRIKFIYRVSNIGVQSINIEDKASGTGLIQTLNNAIARGSLSCPMITPIQRHIDKVARALTAVPSVERGDVVIPDDAPWLNDYLSEMESFTENMTHRHDDQVDPTMDAIHTLLTNNSYVDYTNVV